MKKTLSLILCLCLAVTLLMGLTAEAGAEMPPDERDLIILFTSDVHCGVDQGWGYAGLYDMREKLSESSNVLLVDVGDAIQGEPIGLLTRGAAIIDIMNVMNYDAAIPGNHEFDFGVPHFVELTEKANFPYLSCNFNKEGELVFEPWLIKEIGGMKIGFVGVTTPDTIRSSIPSNFQDENGNFIYGFLSDETGEAVYNAVQQSVDAVRAAGADYVVVLGHMGNSTNYAPWMYSDVISHCSGIDAWLDGHTHDTDQVVMKDRDGKDVVRAGCGTKLAQIGVLHITRDGKISSELFSWGSSIPAPELLQIDNAASVAVSDAVDDVNAFLAETAAVTEVDLRMSDPSIRDYADRPLRIVRIGESNLGNLVADAFLAESGADIAFMGGGCICADMTKGDITFNNILMTLPYASSYTVIEATGQQVLDMLEWSVSRLPAAFGGFAQVAGVTFEYDSTVETPCVSDDSGLFDHVDEAKERRVRSVLVAGKPIDPDATYKLASVEYYLLNNGDGYTMFDGAKVLQTGEKFDCEVFYNYITQNLGGHIGKGYEEMYGEGRIVSVNPES
ncbi:MAG: bifunctional metallophosphatase/5'-nucleotidase [Oscillospiraceae bacterium]|nr:bifunctional metallophosphatase/5'-nucleotidase [Oscillospiraceae bacterium]